MSVLVNNGDGTFQAASPTPLGRFQHPYCDDVDGDGNADLFGAYPLAGVPGAVCTALGRGDGTFRDATCVDPLPEAQSRAVAIAHLDGDGRPDMVLAYDSGHVVPLLGNGDGTFRVLPAVAADPNPYPKLSDLDGDGLTDLLVTESGGSSLRLYAGLGDGTFLSGASYSVGMGSGVPATLTDVTGDDRPDLVLAYRQEAAIEVIPLFPDGVLGSDRRLDTSVPATAPTAGDLDGDGRGDVLAVTAARQAVPLFLATGDLRGYAEPPGLARTGPIPSAVAVADADGDGQPDLLDLSLGEGTLGVHRGVAGPEWHLEERAAWPVGPGPVAMVVRDLDRDGDADVAAALRDGAAVAVLLNGGAGVFSQPVHYPVGDAPPTIAAADLDGDGADDLVTPHAAAGELAVLFGRGDGTFRPAVPLPVCVGVVDVALADVTGDGRPDVALACASGGSVGIRPWVGGPDGLLGPSSFRMAGVLPQAVRLRDLDGDLQPDLVAALEDAQAVTVLYGRGDGTFGDEVRVPLSWTPTGLHLADLDGDGAPELLTTMETWVSVHRGNRIACPPPPPE